MEKELVFDLPGGMEYQIECMRCKNYTRYPLSDKEIEVIRKAAKNITSRDITKYVSVRQYAEIHGMSLKAVFYSIVLGAVGAVCIDGFWLIQMEDG